MNIFRQKDDPHIWCIPEMTDSIKQVRSMSNNSCLKGPFEEQHGKLAQTLLKSKRKHLYHIYWPLWRQLTYKTSLLVIFKIWGLFVNTLSADDNYSLLDRENLMQSTQMQLSQKQKNVSPFFSDFLKSSWNFE